MIIVGNNPASRVYVNSKRKDCEECGFFSEEYALPEETTQGELIALIEQRTSGRKSTASSASFPLPQGIDEEAVLMAISPEKDVDGFHPMNMGALLVGKEGFLPCTPYGIMEILKAYHIDPKGKQCVVIGRSNIVGKPMALLLLQKHGTVTFATPVPRIWRRSAAPLIFWWLQWARSTWSLPDMVKPAQWSLMWQ